MHGLARTLALPKGRGAVKMRVEFSVAGGYLSPMRRALVWLYLVGWLAVALSASAATGRVIKVLPQYLDLKGRNSLTPSLYERDAYQSTLRQSTNMCSGMRFYVQWKAKGQVWEPLKLWLEMRGVAHGDYPKRLTLERPVETKSSYSHWTKFDLVGEAYKEFGQVTAWRVTLWEGDKLLGEQKSFLW
jgi:hypothetical protein